MNTTAEPLIVITDAPRGGYYCATGRVENLDWPACSNIIHNGDRALRKQWAPGAHYHICAQCAERKP